ncbi:MAG: hypothetical protein ISR54_03025 [Chlorobium phaeobacteroides]|uniref:Lipoprotein n=1 Tax=Chlorobium phaeobacteroides (strain BS1) TaxID=331678 RepID=B3EMA7_CHLPB|nr:hypothetical protein [Chlorobium phaeobacteroides]
MNLTPILMFTVKKHVRVFVLLAIPCFVVACDKDNDNEKSNPTCPNAAIQQGQNQSICLEDGLLPDAFFDSRQQS